MKERILKVKYVDEVRIFRTGRDMDPFGIFKPKLFDIYVIDAYPGDFWQLRKSVRDYDNVLVTFHDEDKPHSPTIGMKGKKYMEIARKHNLRLIKSKEPTITFNPEFNEIVNKIMEKRRLEQKGGILDKVEKEYLGAVIKPFRDQIDYIEKYSFDDDEREFICIVFKDDNSFSFPNFKKGAMYAGMLPLKEYTLKEIGL